MFLKVEKIISSGDGIGWSDGKTFFVPYSIPGEVIELISFTKEKSYYKVNQFKVVEPSYYRRNPICPNFGICGGCSFLHIDYLFQTEIKKQILLELFKQKKIQLNKEIKFISIGEFNTRTRAKVWFKDGEPGFKKQGSNQHIPFKYCSLIHPELNEIIYKNRNRFSGDIQFEYSLQTKEWIPDKKEIKKFVLNTPLIMRESCFFQSSEKAAEVLVKKVLEIIDKTKPKSMLDLFCGIGLFSYFAAEKGCVVTGMESSLFSVNCAALNLKNKNNVKKCDVNKITALQNFDFIVIDPPRAGLEVQIVEVVSKTKNSNIAYISCNPSTFIRDFLIFEKYGFAINEITILDLFPATNHFELFVHLTR